MRTFLDACVLIAAFQGNEDISERAFEIIDDTEREFVISDYLKLELIPKPKFHGFQEEVEFYETFFSNAAIQIVPNPEISAQAIELASQYDLSPIDALHISAAKSVEAEFITAEKQEKPFFKVADISVTTIYLS